MGQRSPSCTPLRNTRKAEVIDKPDLGWRAVGRRHQFLLSMLVILTLLCTVYLYFAITVTGGDKCTRLQGRQKSQCYEIEKKDSQIHGLERRQVLLRQGPYEDMTEEDVTEENVIKQEELPMVECGKEFEHYSPCRNGSFFPGVCRERDERPPMCRVPAPWDYQNPEVWNDQDFESLFPAEGEQIASIEFDFASSVGVKKILTVGCHEWKISSFSLIQDRDEYTLSILGGNTSGLCTQKVLRAGFPALLLTLQDYHRFPAHSFDLIRSTECGDQWHLMDEDYLSNITRLLRPGGYFIGGCIVHNLKWSRDRKKLILTSVARFADLNVHKTNMHGELNGLVNIAALTLFIFRNEIRWNLSSHRRWRVNFIPSDSSEGLNTTKYNKTETVLDDGPDVHGVFAESSYIWKPKIAEYVELLGNSTLGEARNMLDMNAGWGSFGAVVMNNYRVWVMNVVAPGDQESLDAIHARGMVGIQHDWMEAFPTPPRSYDLVHSSWTFSNLIEIVDMIEILLEVDRILRPEGLFIVRDSVEIVSHIKTFPSSLRWRVLHEYLEEYLDEDIKNEQVLIIRKEE